MPNLHAPEFPPDLPWLNVSSPLSLEQLTGKVVILDFWTYGCINCMHVLPDLKKLERKYGSILTVIGVHSPKFTNEQNLANLAGILKRYDIHHPVIQDVHLRLWQEYGIHSWPTLVIIDPAGYIAGSVSGEGHFTLLDSMVANLLEKHAQFLDSSPLPLMEAIEEDSLLRYPGKIASKGSMIGISDSGHHRIIISDLEGNILDTFGSGSPGNTSGIREFAEFNNPQGLFFDENHLYVADTGNHLIRRIELSNGRVETIAGNGGKQWHGPGRFGALTIGLNSPWDVAVDGYSLFIAMAGSHQIWQMDLYHHILTKIAGSGHEDLRDGNSEEAAFSQPSGLAINRGILYVADAEDSAIRRIDLDQDWVSTLIGQGLFDYGDIDGPLSRAKIQHALGIAAQGSRIYIADTYNNRIKSLELLTGTIESIVGTGEPGCGNGIATQSSLREPGGLAVVFDGLMIADTGNHRILHYDSLNASVEELNLVGRPI